MSEHKPAALTSFELGVSPKGEPIATFQRNLPAPRDELIIAVSALPAKAAAFEATRPGDAFILRRAAQAATTLHS